MSPQGDPSAGRPATASTPEVGAPPVDARRFEIIRVTIVSLLLVLVAGLAYWQLSRAADYTARERRQNQRRVLVPAPRGVIYDREHRVLAGNRTRISAVLDLGRLREAFAEEQTTGTATRARLAVVQRQLDRVNAITGRPRQIDATQLERHYARERMMPFVLVDELTAKESLRLGAALAVDDPLQLNRSTQRWYPHGRTAAHALGRVRRDRIQAGSNTIGPDLATFRSMGTIGDSGIEKQHDTHLQGRPGEMIVRIDAEGFPLDPPLLKREPVPGRDLVLSLDLDLQLAAERAMAATPGVPRGAAVVIAVQTGEILALASKPDFDLNAVSPTLTASLKQQIDAEGGWLNRALQGLYPPGSSFKIFTMLAGLRRGTLHPTDILHCDGFYDVGEHRFPCHNPAGHGDLTLRDALAHSCNVFAYRTGLAAGADALSAEARRFHLGEPTGVDLPFETRQMLVPDPAAKQPDGRENWSPIDTANLSIGQGFLRYTPLQAACAMASLARRETLTVPTLLHQAGRRPSGNRPPEPLGLADSDYTALIESLQAVILTGIGRDAQVPGLNMAGKTGTAQVIRKEGMMNVAWFVAFAPVERPEIAIAVALEGDRPNEEFAGAEHAAPVVRKIAGAWFDKRAKR